MKRTRKILLWTVLAVVVLAITLVIVFPFILSSSAGRDYVLKRVNHRIAGTVQAESWRVRWGRSIEVSGLTFERRTGDVRITVPTLKCSKGLFPLWREFPDAGTIVMIKPRVEVRQLGKTAAASGADQPGSSGPRAKGRESSWNLESMTAHVLVHNATINAFSSNQPPREVLHEVNLDLDLKGLDQPLQFDLSAAAGKEEGSLVCKGSLFLPHGPKEEQADLHVNTILSVTNLVMDDSFALLSSLYPVPQAKGVVNAKVGVSGSRSRGFQVAGESCLIDGLELMDEVSGKMIKFGDLELDIDATVLKSGVDLRVLNIQSSFCRVNASGTIGGPDSGRFTALAEIDLQPFTELLGRFNLAPRDWSVSGALVARASGSSRDEKVFIEELRADVANLVLVEGERSFRDRRFSISTAGEVDLAGHRLDLKPLDMRMEFGGADLEHLTVEDWAKWPRTLDLSGGVDVGIEETLKALKDFVKLPEGTTLTGDVKTKLAFAWPEDGRRHIKMNADLKQLKYSSKEWPSIDEKQSFLTLDAEVDEALKDITFHKLFAATKPFSLDVVGDYEEKDLVRRLSVTGKVGQDMAVIADYLNAKTGGKLVMEGKTSKPVTFESQWTGATWKEFLKQADLDLELDADRVEAFGFAVGRVTMPVYVRNGVGRLYLDAGTEGGGLSVRPTIDFKRDDRWLVMPNSARVIDAVTLDDRLSDELLGLIHPLFTKARVSGGTMSMTLDHLAWPMGADAAQQQPELAGRVAFDGVTISDSALVRALLAEIQVKAREIELGQREFQFQIQGDRIVCSPVKILVEGYTVVITGSMGLDQTIEYQAQLPMTQELVGTDLYEYAEGLTISIPIRGTALNPTLSTTALNDMISDLAARVTKKAIEEEATKVLLELEGTPSLRELFK